MAIPDDIKMTPWLSQYRQWKAEYPDALLLFRMGDFYELFFDDARTAASILDIALTARDAERKIPMAGVPHHALSLYLGRLIKAGCRAAICEQIGEPTGKGVVERRVVRLVTPGTYVPEESGDTGRLAAVLPLKDGRVALALLSVETGGLEAGTLPPEEAAALLSAFTPGEVLHPATLRTPPDFLKGYALLPAAPEVFRAGTAAERLRSALGGARLASFGIEEDDPCAGPAWAVLDYLSATQFSAVRHVLRITPLRARDRMSLDAAAQRNLELVPEFSQGSVSLLACLDRCRTPMGRRTLREWLLRPLMDIPAIERRQACIGVLVEDPARLGGLQDALAGARDAERALSRLSLGTGTPRDLAAIRDTLRLLPCLRSLSFPEPLAGLFAALPDLEPLRAHLDEALEEELPRVLGAGPVVRSSFSAELASWRDVSERGEAWLAEYLERERAATGSPRLRSGYNRAFGYYLEIGRTGLETVPPHFERRQTLVNAERFVTPELRDFQDRMARSEGEIARIEGELYRAVVERVISEGADIQMTGRLLGILDCAASSAQVARERGYVRPTVDDSMALAVRGGRHPVLEATLTDATFVPNDVVLGGDAARIVILTGPNMAGKSTWLRMAALLAVMAQAGLWVPAESASFGLVDRVFTRIGARDDLVRGNSTFMVEMLETAGILNNVTDRSLVILDEVGRGTATWDGMSIAWAVLEYLHGGCGAAPRVLFATHCHELTCLEDRLDDVRNCSMAVAEGTEGIVFLHQVVPRPADRSYGIEVARLAGLPKPVLRRAFELLELFEREGFERSSIPDPLPQNALRRQLLLFSPETDAVVEELAELDLDNITPMRAMEVLYRMKEKSMRARDGAAD
ncbi:DNA mismatch repair protein MutS [uncultured Fretibacterium sp.]|uniref:DNA mismatch repair protein MutS n=1 Tax=uncultured Fretibacterium sp. TaxID=1678694 RepID=UPI00325FC4E9